MKIVFLDRKSIRDEVVLTKPNFAHEWVEYDNTEIDEIIPRAADADVIITNKVPLRKETLKSLPQLKMIAQPQRVIMWWMWKIAGRKILW